MATHQRRLGGRMTMPCDGPWRYGLLASSSRWLLRIHHVVHAQVVHSRTFGNAGPDGTVAVRMLVPVVDMLNHAGARYAADATSVSRADNVAWDVVGPSRAMTGGWELQLAATRAIAKGEELLLSYGDRDNDDFLVHYGFVPPRNPFDGVVLFQDIEDAAEWLALHRDVLYEVLFCQMTTIKDQGSRI